MVSLNVGRSEVLVTMLGAIPPLFEMMDEYN
jgi:hypothetical protein